MRWLAIIIATWAVLLILPPSLWYETHELRVDDAVVGQAPQVHENRTIRNGFTGVYLVEVRDVGTREYACGGFGIVSYIGGLDGWRRQALTSYAGGDTECRKLPPGRYVLHVQRRISWFGFMRGARAQSNEFQVRDAG
jgi:hypothetical protein